MIGDGDCGEIGGMKIGRGNQCGICGGQSGAGVFSMSTSVSPANLHKILVNIPHDFGAKFKSFGGHLQSTGALFQMEQKA
jgi:hypothetical protein